MSHPTNKEFVFESDITDFKNFEEYFDDVPAEVRHQAPAQMEYAFGPRCEMQQMQPSAPMHFPQDMQGSWQPPINQHLYENTASPYLPHPLSCYPLHGSMMNSGPPSVIYGASPHPSQPYCEQTMYHSPAAPQPPFVGCQSIHKMANFPIPTPGVGVTRGYSEEVQSTFSPSESRDSLGSISEPHFVMHTNLDSACAIAVQSCWDPDPTFPVYDNNGALVDLTCMMFGIEFSEESGEDVSVTSESTEVSNLTEPTYGTLGTSGARSFAIPKTESAIGDFIEAMESNGSNKDKRRNFVRMTSGSTIDENEDDCQESPSPLDTLETEDSQSSSKKKRKNDNIKVSKRVNNVLECAELPRDDFRLHFMNHIAKCTNEGDSDGLKAFIHHFFTEDVSYMHKYKGRVNPFGAKRLTVQGIEAVSRVWLGFQSAIPDGILNIHETKVTLLPTTGESQIHATYNFTGTKTFAVVSDDALVVAMASQHEDDGKMTVVASNDLSGSQIDKRYSTNSLIKGVNSPNAKVNVLSAITYYLNAKGKVHRIDNILTVVQDQQPLFQ